MGSAGCKAATARAKHAYSPHPAGLSSSGADEAPPSDFFCTFAYSSFSKMSYRGSHRRQEGSGTWDLTLVPSGQKKCGEAVRQVQPFVHAGHTQLCCTEMGYVGEDRHTPASLRRHVEPAKQHGPNCGARTEQPPGFLKPSWHRATPPGDRAVSPLFPVSCPNFCRQPLSVSTPIYHLYQREHGQSLKWVTHRLRRCMLTRPYVQIATTWDM